MHMHVNEWVEVRSRQEILQTLDKNGRLDGMPFMPQMFQYCGKRFKIHKSAHKTCDPIHSTDSRSVANAVHLDLRCDGQAYGGCQAGCRLFWKEAWLKPVGVDAARSRVSRDEGWRARSPNHDGTCTEEDVWRGTRRDGRLGKPTEKTEFVCQNTEITGFTKPLSWWNPLQYTRDYRSGNVTLVELLRGAIYVLFGRRFGRRIPALRRMYDAFQRLTGDAPSPVRTGLIPVGQPQPTAILNLQAGDLVRVKSHEEILATLDTRNMNRGMSFDAEMVPYCGGVYRVAARVERFLDEKTARITSLKTPAVILEHVTCHARFSRCRMFCPRGIYSWWREVWLERVEETGKNSAAEICSASPRLQADGNSLEAVRLAD
jgi:hypothetical protein